MKEKNQLKNKHILVTGASSGIGFQIAKDFLLEGAKIINVKFLNLIFLILMKFLLYGMNLVYGVKDVLTC